MRLFTAIDISAEVRTNLVNALRQLHEAARFQWSPPDNLHITTKFIGEWPEAELARLRTALTGLGGGEIDLRVRGMGWFPNPHSPRVLYAGIEAGPELAELHRRTDAACAKVGIPAEEKKFNAHLTLARIRSAEGLQEVRKQIFQLPSDDFGAFTARTFHLYQSTTGPGGAKYEKLEEFALR